MAIIRVKHAGNPGDFVLIEPEMFNSAYMQPYDEEAANALNVAWSPPQSASTSASAAPLEPPTENSQESATDEVPTDPQVRAEAIANAINQLDGTEENWTKDGKPVVYAIEEKLGWDITARERNVVWEGLSQ